jgi:hypothetical protein
MIVWTPVAVNEKPYVQGKTLMKPFLPEYSAAVIGSSVVLRVYGGGGNWLPLTSLSFALTTIPFASPGEAYAWVEANRADVDYELRPPAPATGA